MSYRTFYQAYSMYVYGATVYDTLILMVLCYIQDYYEDKDFYFFIIPCHMHLPH